ncbi:unnamed protein product [Caenorhabditis brenneri]
MIEMPISLEKSESSITSEKQQDIDAVATSPMACHMDSINTVAENLAAASKDTTSNQISSAKDDEIEAARKRMEAYIAGKTKGRVNAESTSQRTSGMVASATEQTIAQSKNRIQVASKQFAVTKASNTVAHSSSAVLHQGVPFASDNTPITKSEISPAKGDELASAEERMKKFLEEKARKQGSVASGRFGVRPTLDGNFSVSSAVVSTNSKTSSTAEPQSNVLKQISPAEASELAAAQKRMEAFLAKKQESGSVGRSVLTVSAVPLIARQANEKKDH